MGEWTDGLSDFSWFTIPAYGDMKAIGGQNKAGTWRLFVIPDWFTPEFKETDICQKSEGKIMIMLRCEDKHIGDQYIKGEPAPPIEHKSAHSAQWVERNDSAWLTVSHVNFHNRFEIDGVVVWEDQGEVKNGW